VELHRSQQSFDRPILDRGEWAHKHGGKPGCETDTLSIRMPGHDGVMTHEFIQISHAKK
jgi:hypothetical protein